MAKARSQFVCQQCGASFSKWAGRCENCGEWNSLVEQVVSSGGSSVVDKSAGRGKVLKTSSIREAASESGLERLSTGIDDLDAVLGGGFLVGGVVLVAGQPGIGKSTLLAQVAAHIAKTKSVLYVSGEESVSQVKLRAERLGAANSEKMQLASRIARKISRRQFSKAGMIWQLSIRFRQFPSARFPQLQGRLVRLPTRQM